MVSNSRFSVSEVSHRAGNSALSKAPSAPGGAEVEGDKVVSSPARRKLRKGLIKAAAAGLAAYDAAVAVPDSVLLGLDTYAGKSDEAKRANTSKLSVLSHTVAASAMGALLAGPVGLVCGGVVGFLSGTMSNHLDGKSGIAERRQCHVTAGVTESVGDQKGLGGRLKAALAGAAHGVKETFKNRLITAQVQLAGTADGLEHVVQSKAKGTLSDKVVATAAGSDHGLLVRLLQGAAGMVCGISGVMINAPGGLIIGILESLKDDNETRTLVPTQLTKTTMLLATNIGKFLPAAAMGALIGGPVGIAASTAVGLVNASLATIIDGGFGLNHRIATPVAGAVAEAHGGQESKDGLRAYYRAGKGAVVGLAVGAEQGWRTGRQGGIDIVNDMIGTTDAVAKGSPG